MRHIKGRLINKTKLDRAVKQVIHCHPHQAHIIHQALPKLSRLKATVEIGYGQIIALRLSFQS